MLAIVSIRAADRVGLISAITDHLFSAGINLGDTSFAVLGKASEFSSICELPAEMTPQQLHAGLAAIPMLGGAEIRCAPFGSEPAMRPEALVTHRIEIGGGDQPGLIARLSDIFAQFRGNIVRLDAQKVDRTGEPSRYVTRFAVHLPPDQAEKCLAAINNTAGSLRLTCRLVG